jgi:DNA-binding CsgD family transcriptional regulator
MFENYQLVFPGTNMHLLICIIIVVEIIFLVYQIIFYLNRPTDKNRARYVILLFLLIVYNITGGIFSDPRLPVPINLQYILEYGAVILMSIYIPFYIYKFLDLPKLKFYAYYGSLYFLLIPFIATFVIPFALTGNIDLCRNLIIIVPFFYSISFLFALVKSIIKKLKNRRIPHYKEKVIGIFITLFFWIMGLSVITYVKGGQIMEHSVTNAGFLIMTFIFIRSSITDSRLEYQKLLQFQQANELLQIKVTERTKELEAVIDNSGMEYIPNQNGLPKKELHQKNSIYDSNCKKYHITGREKEIINLISYGLTYKEISLQLNLSEKTLIKHRSNIFKKVKVNKKLDLLHRLFNSGNQLSAKTTLPHSG